MATWDELCLLCGLYPRDPASDTMCAAEIAEEIMKNIVSSILENAPPELDLDEPELELIVMEPLIFCCDSPQEWFEQVESTLSSFEALKEKYPLAGSYWPPGAGYYGDERKSKWEGWRALAIGTFDKDGNPMNVSLGGRVVSPSGSKVITRLVKHDSGRGCWEIIVDPVLGNINGYSDTSGRFGPNIFCCVGPFHYLEAWLDLRSLPPRSIAFPLGPATMSLAGELYEIVGTRKTKRDMPGFLPYIQYGGIEAIWDQWVGGFNLAWTSAKNLTKALSSGLRGPDLVPALYDDFLIWQCAPPDIWSHRLDGAAMIPQSNSKEMVNMEESVFHRLPSELLDQILDELSLFEALTLISISRSIIYFFNKPLVIYTLLRRRIALPLGSLHWLLPVTTMKGEEDRFLEAMKSWFPVAEDNSSVTIYDPSFPLFEFVRANYCTSSMKNRRRLWDISQQFRRLWIQYRIEGYEENIYGFGTGPNGYV